MSISWIWYCIISISDAALGEVGWAVHETLYATFTIFSESIFQNKKLNSKINVYM